MLNLDPIILKSKLERYFLYKSLPKKGLFKRLEKYKYNISKFLKDEKVNVDAVVTIDVSRIIRAPNSIYGKTGFLSKIIEKENLEKDFYAWDFLYNTENIAKIKIKKHFKFYDKFYNKGEIMEISANEGYFLVASGIGDFLGYK